MSRGLWANILAKRRRIARGSGERMRSKGDPGAPTDQAIKNSQTSKKDKAKKLYPKMAQV